MNTDEKVLLIFDGHSSHSKIFKMLLKKITSSYLIYQDTTTRLSNHCTVFLCTSLNAAVCRISDASVINRDHKLQSIQKNDLPLPSILTSSRNRKDQISQALVLSRAEIPTKTLK